MSDFDYEHAWTKVDSCDREGLPASALTIVNDIYKNADQEANAQQLVKALLHQLKFTENKEEDAYSKIIERVKSEISTTKFPTKPLLHSMLAQLYWQYYEQNRWRFRNRSTLTGRDDQDLKTWSTSDIVKESVRHYLLSLEHSDGSKETPIRIFEEITKGGNDQGKALRPTLFDFLAHRAADFFMSDEPDITRPALQFTLDDAQYLGTAESFAKMNINSQDTLSFKYHALRILQELTRFHLEDKDPKAMAWVDMKRLDFVRDNLTLSNKDVLYLQALETLEHRVLKDPVSTYTSHRIAEHLMISAEQYEPLGDSTHQWDLKKAYERCQKALTRYPESAGAAACKEVMKRIEEKSMEAITEAINLPEEPIRIKLGYKNVDKVYWKIIPTTYEQIQNQQRLSRNDSYPNKRLLEFYLSQSATQSGELELPVLGDFQEHSIEFKINALKKGYHMILLSHDPEYRTEKNGMAYTFTNVSSISYIHRNTQEGHTSFYILDRESGQSLPGTKAEVRFSNYDYQSRDYVQEKGGTFTADKNGYLKVPYQNKDRRRNSFFVKFSLGDDVLYSINPGESNYGNFRQYKEREREERRKTLFFLDRAIYRPGQTIYFKGLVMDTDGISPSIRPNYRTTITLRDVNGQEVSKQTFTTNDYGSFQGSFTAPSSGLMGNMRLMTSDNSGMADFSVEEYKRPQFEVNFPPIEKAYKLNETLQVTGQAQAYSGANIDGAQVSYRVIRRARFPYWCWVNFGYYPDSPEVEITNGTVTTDKEGKFEVEFIALADPLVPEKTDPTFIYTVYADVTDINGETHSEQTDITIGYTALKLGTDIGNLDKSDADLGKKEFQLQTTNLGGGFEAAQGTVSIYPLNSPKKAFRERLWERPDLFVMSKEEFYTAFPNDAYADEANPETWKRKEAILTARFDTGIKKTFQIEDIASWPTGHYVLEIKAKDPFGQEVKEVTFFQVIDKSSKQATRPAYHYFDVSPNAPIEPGSDAEFLLGTSLQKLHVLFEIEQDGRLLKQQWLDMSNTQQLLKIDIKEAHRGNITAHFAYIKDNRALLHHQTIIVPHSDKELDIQFETFRDKLLPGAREEWRLKISGKKADRIAAEMAATMYDASLDTFRPHAWQASLYSSFRSKLTWFGSEGFSAVYFQQYKEHWNNVSPQSFPRPSYEQLNWFGLNFYGPSRMSIRGRSGINNRIMTRSMEPVAGMAMAEESDSMEDGAIEAKEPQNTPSEAHLANADRIEKEADITPKEDFSQVKVRSNFNETAFFFPEMRTNAQGEIILSFTVPEALTRWKMLGFAHTKDLNYGMSSKELVTQKELMVVPNAPRFFRENDSMFFSAKVISLAEKGLNGQARLEFFDALSGKSIDNQMKLREQEQNFSVAAGESTSLSWALQIPEGIQAITYRVIAKAGNFSDGEEMTLPVTTNRMLVTETLPLPIRGGQKKEFIFEKMLNNNSPTLKHHRYTLEFTGNPAWYAVQALPYLMEYPYDCIEQTFSQYYANSLASHIANSHPKIKKVFDTWKTRQPDALLSNLEKNPSLKAALLEETPWVLQAQDESQRKRRVALLFDLNRMANEQAKALNKIMEAQVSSGGFPWFPGLPEDRYMTQHIVAGLAHLIDLKALDVKTNPKVNTLLRKAVRFLDRAIYEDHEKLKRMAEKGTLKLEEKHLSSIQIHYLYVRSYFPDLDVDKKYQDAVDYYRKQGEQYWLQDNRYLEGMLALALHRYGNSEIPGKIIASLKERALHSEELGMYWKSKHGYYWYESDIEAQAMMIELFEEVAKDEPSVEELKTWLLKQKQTQDWKTTKATAEACYALLRRGTDLLTATGEVEIQIGRKSISPQDDDASKEAGTGYFKTSWSGSEIKKDMAKISIHKKDKGVAWGAVYWQYFEQLDKITSSKTPLEVKKELFQQINTESGPVLSPISENTLKVGDMVKVRIEIRVDRNMEYVHLKDMRASGLEPVGTLSTHRYQNGLWYYESSRDMATHFFIGRLPKGTYVFEYPLKVAQKGDFSNGITTMQCMYAPEFSSHSQGIRVHIE